MEQTVFFIENGEGYDDFAVFGAVIGTESDRDKITKIMESVVTDYHEQCIDRERRDEEEWRKFREWLSSPEGTKKGSIYKERLILDWIGSTLRKYYPNTLKRPGWYLSHTNRTSWYNCPVQVVCNVKEEDYDRF